MTKQIPMFDASAFALQDKRDLRAVLVVDDSRAHRKLLARTLEKWGYGTIEAGSADEALKYCRSTPIELIISDWMMPGMSGAEFCREFRSLANGRPAYFILLTAQTERAVLAEGLDSGADDFLSKPFSSIELRARLRAGERVLNAQNDMAEKNAELSNALGKLSDAYSAIDRDLREARKFQEALVHERHIPIGSVDMTLLYRPSGHVGGDLVGYFKINDTEIGLFAVDVSGHGVTSALMTARIAGYLTDTTPERNIALTGDAHSGCEMIPPEEVCAKLNSLLRADSESDQYLTMLIGTLNIFTGALSLCHAGHPSPVIQRRNGSIELLEHFGMPIGLVDDAEFAVSTATLAPGDRLFIYSDGITECPGNLGAMLEEEGLIEILRDLSMLHGQNMIAGLVDRLEQYAGRTDFPDDLSAIMIERRLGPRLD